MTTYDDNNIFAKIIRGEIPSTKVYEDEYTLAFHDISKRAPVHVLVIPKTKYVNLDDFSINASIKEQAGLMKAIGKVARETGVAESVGGNGYRVISNAGKDGNQEVNHLHFHILGGKNIGPLIAK